MRKLLLLTIALMPLAMMAEQRSANEAKAVAASYLNANAPRRLPGVNTQAPNLSLEMTAVNSDRQVDYYVFNNGTDRGFVIVSGDDKAVPVMGYSDKGTFDANHIPDGLQYMLDCYAEQMQYLRSHPQSASAAPRQQFDISVTPLLSCNWNQDAPFNNLCPTYGPQNTRAATGCAATAAAQIMYYYKWPQKGIGSETYTCKVNDQDEQTLSADFGSTTYDWENMLDNYVGSYNEAQGNAVATLMYHVGVAAHMKYGDNSAVSAPKIAEGMANHFGYNKRAVTYMRPSFPAAEWDSIILAELRNARPILFSGFTPQEGGHAFVLDGCNTDGYYHFNWGWGGMSNGYFLTSILNPSDQGIGSYEGGYTISQMIVTGLYPDPNSEPPAEGKFAELICEDFRPVVSQMNLGSQASFDLKHMMVNAYGYPTTVTILIGYILTDADKNTIDFDGDNIYSTTISLGTSFHYITSDGSDLKYKAPASLANGDYQLRLAFKINDGSMAEYQFVTPACNAAGYINAKVRDGVMYFSIPESPAGGNLSLSNLTAPDVVGSKSKFNVSATIFNEGKEYNDSVYFAFFKDGASVKVSPGVGLSLIAGDDVSFTTSIEAPAEVGDYELKVLDKNHHEFGGSKAVKVQRSYNFYLTIGNQLQVNSYYMDADNVGGTAVINNTGSGDFVGSLPFMITDFEAKQVIVSGYSDVVSIPAGTSATVNVRKYFEGAPGIIYLMSLCDIAASTGTVWGNMVPFEVNSPSPIVPLAKVIANGEAGQYCIGDNLIVVDTHATSLFVTNGHDSWVELKGGDNFNALSAMKAFKTGTVYGNFAMTDGNPSITLTKLPEAGNEQEVATLVDLSQAFTPEPTQVVDFSGYYFVEDGTPVIRAEVGADGGKGARIEFSTQWLPAAPALVQGKHYTLHGVAMRKPGTSDTPRLTAQGGANFDNFVVYLTTAPDVSSAVSNIADNRVGISVAGGVLTVTGAKRIKVYNAAGALVSTSAITRLPVGVYVVAADAKCQKVLVR